MEVHEVKISLTLFQKVNQWVDNDQVIFSAFIQCLREFDAVSVLGGFNCALETFSIDHEGSIE